jgi:hypothetical protein
MTMKDFKANRRKIKRKEASDDAEKRGHVGKEWHNTGRKYSPDEAKSGRANMSDYNRQQRYKTAEDPDSDNADTYPAVKTKNPKKLRKQKAMGEITKESHLSDGREEIVEREMDEPGESDDRPDVKAHNRAVGYRPRPRRPRIEDDPRYGTPRSKSGKWKY